MTKSDIERIAKLEAYNETILARMDRFEGLLHEHDAKDEARYKAIMQKFEDAEKKYVTRREFNVAKGIATFAMAVVGVVATLIGLSK